MKRLLILLLFSSFIYPQKKLNVDLDYSRFNYDDSTGYLELYYGFPKNQLKAVTVENKKVVNGIIQIKIKDKATGNGVLEKSWQISDYVNPSGDAGSQLLNGVINLRLAFGSFSFFVLSYDGNDNSVSDTISFDIVIRALPQNRFSMSDIQLASSINAAGNKTEDYFVKNNYEVIPNPAGVYGENLPVLYFYSELYNLDKNPSSGFLKVNYLLQNSFEENVLVKTKYIPTKHNSIVDVGALNILKYPTGTYTLQVEVIDTVKSFSIKTGRKLYIYNPSVVDTSEHFNYKTGVAQSIFSLLTDEEVIRYFEYSKYIATQDEKDDWNKISTEAGRKEYLVNFWNKRNKNSGLADNTYQNEYFNRVELANKRYNMMQKSGWKTDRGRVLIMYGEPNEIETHPDEPDMKPYEVWKYFSIESGVTFIFGNIEGFGDYSLIHSTKKGELQDENWQRFIQTNN